MNPRKSWFVVFGTGLIAGLALSAAFLGIPTMPRASAQQPLPAPQRYSASSWGYAASPGYAPSHGLYILDNATGKVWVIEGSQPPHSIGKLD